MRLRTVLPALAGILAATGLAVAGTVAPAQASTPLAAPGAGLFGHQHSTTLTASAYTYVYGRQSVATDGANVSLQQATPSLAGGDYHSLAELAVQSADGNQIVEIGWTVDQGLNGDTQPHLFVFHWIDLQATCYNGCGFVSTSSSIHAGDAVASGQTGTYKIVHANGQWQTWYNGTEVGYFPDSEWGNRYTRAGLVQAFGEVSSATETPCTDMGNGTFGSAAGSAQIGGYSLINGASGASLSVADTNASWYDHGATTATSFRFGGPGAC
ncbi:MAG: neprosin family prolyl endopeptidase [Actinocatenispora sp.]